MKKKLHYLSVLLVTLCLLASSSAYAQGRIDLNRATGSGVVLQSSDFNGFNSTFSFNSIESDLISNEKGQFSELLIDGSFPNGNVGEPQLPMITRLIAIPDGATPVVTVGNYSETEYTLSEYGIGKVSAMQAPIRKNIDPSTVEYAVNEAAYARNSYNDDPIAMVEVLGTMRGITLGRLIVQPVRYNPAAGTIKVFNDVNVKVNFQNGDAASTAQMFKNTFSPAFNSVYDQIFNIDMLMDGGSKDAYTDHPDMYNTPVRMLVICYSGFKNNSALNSWLQWKLQKGYYVDIFYTDETGTTANNIKSFIQTKYNASVSAGNAYTYLIVIGDTGQVPQYMTKTVDYACASDLGYSSVNFTTSSTTNYFPDMYYSRMSVENTTHLTNYINKVLTYEKYEFADGGNYLNNVLLVGGWDSNWTSRVAKPTINYGSNNYFNTSNTTYGGFSGGTIRAIVSTSSSQGYSGTNNGVYNGINDGACIVNYTAHGDRQEWQVPQFTAAQVATLTNTGKYFFGIGNCCLTGNFNNTTTSYSPGSAIGTTASFGETMIRVPNAGAVAYVGCSPYSYWYEDFYWAVGAHSYSAGNAPSVSGSTKGVYDVMFMDNYWNSASSLMYLGNLAVQQAVSNNNTNSGVTDGNCNNSAHYYFQFYHTFGDGSVMPFITKPEANNVTIPSTIEPGSTSMTVNAVAGSYVAVTDNTSVIYGVGVANTSGVATVNFTNAIPNTGNLYVVVTRQQYQPYFGTVEVKSSSNIQITATATPAIIAQGSSSTLKATATGGSSYTYSWTPANSLNNANIQQPTATPTQTTEYAVTVSSNGDSNTAYVTVTVVTPPTSLAAAAVDCNSGVKLTWTAPALATSYKVYRNGTQIAQNVTATTYTDSNLSAGTYSYQIGAVYEGVESKCAAVSKTLDGGTTITNAVSATACDTYTWDGTTYANSGTYTKTFTSAGGCDSVVTLTLTINKSKTNEFSITSEEPYTWNGVTYSHTGDYTQTLGAANGCDSVVTLHLTYTGIEEDCYYTVTPSAAGEYILGYLNGTTLTMPTNANATAMTTAAATVTSTDYGFTADEDNTPVKVTLVSTGTTGLYYITYNGRRLQRQNTNNRAAQWANSTTTTRTSWNVDANGPYQTSGSTTYRLYYYNNSFYVSSSATANLSFYQEGDCPVPCASVTSEFSASACESYTWNGVTYTESGDYTQTFPIGGGSGSEEEIFFYDFDNTPTEYDEWQLLSADDDTLYWGIYSQAGYGHNSSDFLASFSYYNSTDLTPDNFVILPFANISSNTKLSFWAKQLTNGWEDVLGLYVTTATDITSTADFTQIGSDMTISDSTWTQYTLDLSAYAGQSVGITFRHYNCTGQHAVLVDDIRLYNSSAKAPVASHSTNTAGTKGERGNAITCDSRLSQGSQIEWMPGQAAITKAYTRDCDSIVTLHLTITGDITHEFSVETCADSYTWNDETYTESGDYTQTFSLNPEILGDEFLYNFEDSPSSYTGWSIYDLDNDTLSDWGIYNASAYAHSGTSFLLSYSYDPDSETDLSPDDWIVLPFAAIGTNSTFSFWGKQLWNGWDDVIGVYVTTSTNITSTSDFTLINNVTVNDSTYTNFSFDLGAYAGQSVRIALRHYNCTGQGAVIIDDLSLTNGSAKASETPYVMASTKTSRNSVALANTSSVLPRQEMMFSGMPKLAEPTRGCDSIVTLHLTLLQDQVLDPEVITACESYPWYGQTYTTSGTYTHVTDLEGGCTKTETLQLTIVHNETVAPVSIDACESYQWNGTTYTASGTYTHVTELEAGCTKTETLNLTIHHNVEVEPEVVTACESYTWHGTTYTTSGMYEYVTELEAGCERTETLNLTINYNQNVEPEVVTACESYTWHGTTYTTSGMYEYVTTLETGCTKTEKLNLTINYNQNVEPVVVSACESYTWYGTTYDASGTYTHTSELSTGCTKTETLVLTINNNVDVPAEVVEACESYTWHGTTYNTSGNYTYSTDLATGCVQTETLNLTIHNNVTEEPEAVSACESYEWYGTTYTTSGTYTHTTELEAGCTKTETLHLTINHNVNVPAEVVEACEDYTWYGTTYDASGTYTHITDLEGGCTKTETLNLTIHNNVTEEPEVISACEEYRWHEITYTESGTYTYVTDLEAGCTKTETLVLTINHNVNVPAEVVETCESYTWHDTIYTTSGTYTYVTDLEAGCTKTETLNLTIYNNESNESTVSSCTPYTWHGTTYNTSGNYTFDGTTENGCELHETLHLTINSAITNDIYVDACETYTWTDGDGQTYTASGVHEKVYATSTCDSTVYLHLTIHHNETAAPETITECDNYTWNGTTYNESGTYTAEIPLEAGCTRTETLYLTINNSETENFDVTECDSYTWHGISHNTSGTYTYETTTAAGCERIETLNLTINSSEAQTFNVTECDSYTWHGTPYTESGTYTYETTTAAGCQRIETLNLTINYSEHPEYDVTECDTYTWHGTAYTESGTYTYEGYTTTGCPRVETLHLTINTSGEQTFSETACDSYEWHGATYTTSGSYDYISTTPSGCTFTETLNLTINNSETETFNVTECDSYEWHGDIYDMSGVYTYETTTATGCPHVETLNLTINNSEAETFNVTECDSYTWYGQTYTTSGTYTHESTTSANCPRVETLNLTINHAEDVTLEPVTTCDSYVFDGVTYTESQVITTERTDANGCTYTETLNLTINHAEDVTLEPVAACDSYEFDGVTYTESLVITTERTDANGCTYTETLNLTINHAEDVTIEGNTEIVAGEETTLTASEGASYEWSNGETTQSITVAPAVTTTYTVTVTDANGCVATAEIVVSVDDGIGENTPVVNVYPNPTKHVVNVEADDITNIRVVDMLGQTLYETNASSNRVQIDLSGYAVGQYFLEVRTQNGVTTQKVVKK